MDRHKDGDKEFKDQSREEDDALVIPPGPITRAKARRLKEAVGSLLMISWKQEDGLDGRLINQDTLITIQAMVSNWSSSKQVLVCALFLAFGFVPLGFPKEGF